ncbi:hypothetical protein BJY01DRAFT_244713 [Aspergillus pseudoustus]|uniref:Nucleotidyltransferase family protein n=1 Tax=Aspergillus pseudoustus TaxID=1810923 RepID=A0ABR4KIN2_9EURO
MSLKGTPCAAGAITCRPDIPAIATKVAEVLDKADVPNFLWGYTPVSILGADYGYPEIDFIINKPKMRAAQNALTNAGYTLCLDETCSRKSRDGCRHVDADLHFHNETEHLHYEPQNPASFAGIRIYAKGKLTWWVLEKKITVGPPLDNRDTRGDPLFMLTTEADGIPPQELNGKPTGTGPWTGRYAVKMLRPARLYEAIRVLEALYFYDVERRGDTFGALWIAMLTSCSNAAVISEIDRDIKREFRQIFDYYKSKATAAAVAAVSKVNGEKEKSKKNNSKMLERQKTKMIDDPFLPLLRLRRRLLRNRLPHSQFRPELPVEKTDGIPVLPEDDVDPDYMRRRNGLSSICATLLASRLLARDRCALADDTTRNMLPLLTLRWRLVVGDLEQSVGRPSLPVERVDGLVVTAEDGAELDERGD